MRHSIAIGLLVATSACASAQVIAPFDIDDVGGTLVNGQQIDAEFFMDFAISSAGGLGAALCDSDPAGPNAGGGDMDLLVDLGNILIVQDPGSPTQTTAGIFDTANDNGGGGQLFFDFTSPFELLSIDIIDINGNNQDTTVTLEDSSGDTRVYFVPSMWTFDIDVSGPDGYETLDLQTAAPQLGEGGSSAILLSVDAGFDLTDVIKLSIDFNGSGAIDNLTYIPAPPAPLLVGLGLAATTRRRR